MVYCHGNVNGVLRCYGVLSCNVNTVLRCYGVLSCQHGLLM